jgi:hypothetical protein
MYPLEPPRLAAPSTHRAPNIKRKKKKNLEEEIKCPSSTARALLYCIPLKKKKLYRRKNE